MTNIIKKHDHCTKKIVNNNQIQITRTQKMFRNLVGGGG